MLRPPFLRALVTAPSSQAPLRVAAARRASPLQSGAVALGEQRGRKPGRSLRACVCVFLRVRRPADLALTATRPC